MTALALAMRGDRVGQGKCLDRRHRYGAGLDQFDDAFEMRAIAADLRPERLDIVARRRRRGRARGDERRPAAGLENLKRLGRDSAADGIENRIARGHRDREIGGVVIDDLIGPKVAEVIVVDRARRGDHGGTQVLGELDGEAGDATGTALDKNSFARFQPQRVLDGDQGGQTGQGECRAFDMRQPS